MKINSKSIRLGSALLTFFFACVLAQTSLAAEPGGPEWTRKQLGEAAFQELRSYLRCESPVRRNEFGEAAEPDGLFVQELYTGRISSSESTMPFAVWDDAVAQLGLFGGYGFFGVLQYYQAGSLPILLMHLKRDGWKFKEFQTNDAGFIDPPGKNSTKPHLVYQAEAEDGDIKKIVKIVNAEFDFSGRPAGKPEFREGGVTMICFYQKKQ